MVMQWKLRSSGFLEANPQSPLFKSDSEVEAMLGRKHEGFGVGFAPRMKAVDKSFAPLRIERHAPVVHALPAGSMGLRGVNRYVCLPEADQDITVEALRIAKAGTLMRYDAYAASGSRVAGGALKVGSPVQFFTSAGQIYYIEIQCDSPYEVAVKGAPCALAADADDRGLHVSGKATPLYFYVPKGLQKFSLSISTGAPGETSLSKLFSPDGKLVKTFDTQTTPVARETLLAEASPDSWEGFWCLSVGKAPKGGFDDVFITLDENLSPWFSLDPQTPLTVSRLPAQK